MEHIDSIVYTVKEKAIRLDIAVGDKVTVDLCHDIDNPAILKGTVIAITKGALGLPFKDFGYIISISVDKNVYLSGWTITESKLKEYGIPEKFLGKKGRVLASDSPAVGGIIIDVTKTPASSQPVIMEGVSCIICNEYNPWGGPNLGVSTHYACHSCKDTRKYLIRKKLKEMK